MKFKDIKTGDFVIVKKSIKTNFRDYTSFFVKRPVSKVTPKQFEVDGSKYNKSDGKEIGEYFSYAYIEGEKSSSGLSGDVVIDQTEEYLNFKAKIKAYNEIRSFIEDLNKLGFESMKDLKLEDLESNRDRLKCINDFFLKAKENKGND